MKSARVIAAVCLLSGIAPVYADSFNFEDLPTANISAPFGGGNDIGNYYSLLTFNSGVQGNFGSSAFPATSGSQVIWQSDITNPQIQVNINSSAYNEISFWYTTAFGFNATAYDSSLNQVGNVNVAPNSNGFDTGTPAFLDIISSSGAPISILYITDAGGVGNYIAIDDLSVPDATSTLALLGVSALSLFAFRRKLVTQ